MEAAAMIAKLASAALAIGLSFGLNVVLRPEFDTQYDPADYALQAGTITLAHRGGTLEIPLMAIHIVTRDLERLGRSYKIRELALRAVASGGGWPRMELFASLSQAGGDLLGGSHDPSVLLQTELPLALHGRLGARPSYVVLEGSQRNAIVTGTLLITDITQTSNGDLPDYRAQGRIEFQVQTENGVSMVTGKWSGRVVWDATGT
jgi:hypothetical protein